MKRTNIREMKRNIIQIILQEAKEKYMTKSGDMMIVERMKMVEDTMNGQDSLSITVDNRNQVINNLREDRNHSFMSKVEGQMTIKGADRSIIDTKDHQVP